jgi:hypothetical protein
MMNESGCFYTLLSGVSGTSDRMKRRAVAM